LFCPASGAGTHPDDPFTVDVAPENKLLCPVGPVFPVHPVEPVTVDATPVDPVGPVGPVSPVVPVGPVGPVFPVVPVGPVGPVFPVVPVGPVGPVFPVVPVGPVGPVFPVVPVGPVLPVGPVHPVGPVFPVGKEPYIQRSGSHDSIGRPTGLTRWYNEKWIDIKTNLPCGKAKTKEYYPTCRPSVRVTSKSPVTASELSDYKKQRMIQKKQKAKESTVRYKETIRY